MEKVSNIVHVVNLPHDILVSWDAVAGATSYTAELRSGNQAVGSKSVAVPEVPFAALVIGQIYEILITATDGVETSEPARYVVYLSERDWLSPPPDLAYTELETGDGFTVTWGASPSALSYRMVVEPFGVQDPEEVFNGPATSPHVISGLPPEKLFRIYVYPVNGTEEGQPSTIVGWVQPDVGEARPTAHRLFPAEVQGSYYLLYQPYIENMRPLREDLDENYWRLRDDVCYVKGPQAIGNSLSAETYLWKAHPVEEGIAIRPLTTKGEDGDVALLVEEADEVLSVSLEFDQTGAVLLAWETPTGSHFRWYDNAVNEYVVTDLPQCVTPVIGNTYTITPLNTEDSTRNLFYVDVSDHSLRYRQQSERYGTEYTLAVSGEVLEVLSAGPNIYGGFSIAIAVREWGEITQKSFTVFDSGTTRYIGRSRLYDGMVITPVLAASDPFFGQVSLPYTKLTLTDYLIQEPAQSIHAASAGLLEFSFEAYFQFTEVSFSEDPANAPAVSTLGGGLTSFDFQKDLYVFTDVAYAEDVQTLNSSSGGLNTFVFDKDKYTFTQVIIDDEPAFSVSPAAAGLTTFTVTQV